MRKTTLGDVADLIDEAREVYGGDAAALEVLDAYERRLREPLRLAVAGMVKAGKSTMLNALIGEQIAPTDAGECTRTVTWYRHARTARITAYLLDGEQARLPVRRSNGALVLDLGRLTAEEVEYIDVEWPSESLRSTVLIDTPGIASLSTAVSERSTTFLIPEDKPSAADAILYLLRHVHASDLGFLEAFRDTAAGMSQTVNAVAVLSRADEIGSGRIDSLLSASKIADRYRRDGELRSLALGVVPVAGLLAEGARTLRENEFAAFKKLAALERPVREKLLLSVDRFTRGGDELMLTTAERKALLARFGIFGVRLGAVLVRSGVSTSSELSARMVQQSGLLDVQRFVAHQFRARATALKARGVLQGLELLLHERRAPATSALLDGIEKITAATHDLRELSLLAEIRTSVPTLSDDDRVEAERVIGGNGTAALARLGLADSTDDETVRTRVEELLARWRAIGASPLADRATVDLSRVVVRSIEGVASEVGAGRPLGAASDIVLTGGPVQSGR